MIYAFSRGFHLHWYAHCLYVFEIEFSPVACGDGG